uniref:Uncharacterized protein n=1 Tax=Arundo donax TaxID=35708 RepID=A0A0A9BZ43_ARUDO
MQQKLSLRNISGRGSKSRNNPSTY